MSGCAMAQVLRCWPLNADAPVRSRVHVHLWWIVAVGQVFPRQRHSANAAYLYSSRYCSYHKDKRGILPKINALSKSAKTVQKST